MMSPRGQADRPRDPRPAAAPVAAPPTARATVSMAGEIRVEEYGYGLGPPTGILVLRYPPQGVVADFPAQRDDLVHQVFWSPDGALAVRRGTTTRFLSPGQALWLRRGVVAEVRALGVQTVIRACLREAPDRLFELSAAIVEVTPPVGAGLRHLARPGVSEIDGLHTRAVLLDELARLAPDEVTHAAAGTGPALEVARQLLRDPADDTSLGEWAARLHVSPKTMQRDFEREYGASFTTWRTRTRLHASIALLHDRSVTETAHRVGYSSPSAFVAAFTREFGETPGRFAGDRAAS